MRRSLQQEGYRLECGYMFEIERRAEWRNIEGKETIELAKIVIASRRN